MKTVLILTAFVTVTCANIVQDNARKYFFECVKQTSITPDVLTKAANFVEDEQLKKFMLCFLQKTGVMNHDGRLDIGVALSMSQRADKARLKKILVECKKGRNAADTAFELFKCFRRAHEMDFARG